VSENRALIFAIAILYSLEEKWRGIGSSRSFENLLNGQRDASLHLAWLKLKKEGLLGEFSDEFYFDVLYGDSNLTEMLRKAQVRYLLVRLDGSEFAYHVDRVGPREISRFLRQENISAELVQNAAARLNKILGEQEKTATTSTR
jgi:hypothetical protein